MAEHRLTLLEAHKTLLAQERFLALRRIGGWRGFSGLVSAEDLGAETLWRFSMQGAALFNGRAVPEPRRRTDRPTPDQLPVSLSLLRLEGRRPVWGPNLAATIRALQDTSPGAYPHSAKDVLLACDAFARRRKGGAFAVWSSISPWLEIALLRWGVSAVTTVDWNEPKLEPGVAEAAGGELRTLDASNLANAYARGNRFDVNGSCGTRGNATIVLAPKEPTPPRGPWQLLKHSLTRTQRRSTIN